MKNNITDDQKYLDDEIDLMPYIKHIVTHWRLFVYASIVAIVIAVVLSLILPKKYKASTTFLLPEVESSVGGNLLGSFGFGFSSTFDSGASGIYSGYIMPIFNSRRIKKYVAKQFLDHSMFVTDSIFQKIDDDNKIGYIIGVLGIRAVELQLSAGVYVISFEHNNPEILLPVLEAYLDALIQLNEEFNIDSDVLQIIPLDEAVKPTGAFYPNRKKLIRLDIALALGLVFIVLILDKIRLNLWGDNNPKSLS